MDRIPVAGPWITEKEVAYVADAVQTAWYAQSRVYHDRFEALFAERVHRRYAIALPSCTSAIHLALLALGLGPGDEVIVPEITWIASAAPVSYVSARPVFADIDPDSWCLSAASVARKITPRTKAVIAVDLYGNMPDMSALREITRNYGVHLIEDAAQAIGSLYEGQPAGSFGTFSVFSFHGSKTLSTGEGGMLLTDDEALCQRCLFLRDHGRDIASETPFRNTEVAYKYKMSAMQAALGLAQLERLDELVEKKKQIFQWYRDELDGLSGLTLNGPPDNVDSSYWMTTLMLRENSGWDKKTLRAALLEQGIDTRPFFDPLSQLPAYAHLSDVASNRVENPAAYRIAPYGLNLPSALMLQRDDVRQVCRTLRTLLRREPVSQGGKTRR